MLSHWFNKPKRRKSNETAGWRAPRGYQPRIELLEERLAPATITVNTTADTIAGAMVSLRDAVLSINAGASDSAAVQASVMANGNVAYGTNDTINFNLPNPATITLLPGNGALVLTTNMTITGPGAAALTVAGNNTFTIFVVNAGQTDVINGLTISNGANNFIANTQSGGIQNLGSLTLSGDTFSDDTTGAIPGAGQGSGGAIGNNVGATLIINNCAFTNNTATLGGNAAGIDNVGTATVNNSTFTGNNGETGGALVNEANATLNVNGCTITGNNATFINGTGGINNNAGTVTVTGSNISGNNGSDTAGIRNTLNLTVSNSTLANDTTGGNVGGINNNGEAATVTVTNTTFSGDKGSSAGAIFNSGTATVTGCTLLNNTSTFGIGTSGGIRSTVTLTLTNSTLSGNVSASSGGAVYSNGTATIAGCTFTANSNSSGGGGGAVSVGGPFQGGTATISGSAFSGNTATKGGTLYTSGTVTVANSTFTGNAATDGSGGAIDADVGLATAGSVSISGSTITGNTASQRGGGVALNNPAATQSISYSNISGNTAIALGGGVYNNGTLSVTDSILSNNVVTGATGEAEGGGICNDSGQLTVTYCIVSGNQAGSGGGIQNESEGTGTGTATISFTTISNNITTGAGAHEGSGAGFGGGGFQNDDAGVANLTNCTISGNSAGAGTGGGVYNSPVGAAMLTLTNCTIANNTAGAGGGGLTVSDGSASLVNTIVAQNTGGSGPADLLVAGGTLTGTNSLIGDGSSQNSIVNGSSGNIVGTTANPAPALLAPLAYYGGKVILGQGLQTMALLPGSAAINAAGAGAPATDERGIGRVGAPDMGAFESRGFIMTIVSGNPQQGAVLQPYSVPLAVSVVSLFGEPVVGGQVTFTGPSDPTMAEVIFSNGKTSIVVTITGTSPAAASGQAMTIATANAIPGPVLVTASANGANSVVFNLFNVQPLIAVGADEGALPEVKVYDAETGALVFDFFAFPTSFRGGVRVAVGDVNGDGFFDIICAAGPGGGPQVAVYSGKDGSLLQSFYAFTSTFTGGVYVAAGDVNGDGNADIICGAGAGGGPQVSVFNGKDDSLITSFFAFPVFFTGGVRVAAGDVNGDGLADIIVGAGPGGAPEVEAYNGKDFTLLKAYFAFPVNFAGGVYVGAGDLTHSGFASIIVGAGEGGLPEVNVFNGTTFQLTDAFFASTPQVLKVDSQSPSPGVRVAVACEACPHPVILTGEGPFTSPQVSEFDGSTFQQTSSFFAFDTLYLGGIFVGGA